ncbi:ABC transporter substrate-binding protein [Phytoactinopolyspora halophila]|nr:extracellular solute-binding protein [Phytoactinopolyspora halophila]
MRNQRRFVTAAVAATTMVLAACGGDADSDETTEGTGAEGNQADAPAGEDGADLSGTLTLSGTASDRPAVEAVIELFEAEYPDVTVETTFADTEPYQATLRTQLTSGTAPDVFFAWPGNGNPGAVQVLAPNGFLRDLGDRPWADSVPEGMHAVTDVDGTRYLLPMAFSGIGAIYNQAAMDEIGAAAPETWDEVLTLCQTAQDAGKVAFALGNQTNWVTQLINYALAATNVYGADENFVDSMAAGDATFAGSDWVGTMEQYMQMNDAGCFQSDPLGTSYETTIDMVATGDALAVVQGTWAIALLAEQAPDGEFRLAALPATNDPNETVMPGAPSGTFAVNAEPAEPDLALAFIDFMATPEAMNTFAETGGSLPAIPNDQYEVDPALEELIEFQSAGRTVPFMDQLWPNPRVQEAHLTGVQEIFAGETSIGDVLQTMDEAYAKGQ